LLFKSTRALAEKDRKNFERRKNKNIRGYKRFVICGTPYGGDGLFMNSTVGFYCVPQQSVRPFFTARALVFIFIIIMHLFKQRAPPHFIRTRHKNVYTYTFGYEASHPFHGKLKSRARYAPRFMDFGPCPGARALPPSGVIIGSRY
jgi:hypothetical protein